MDKLCAECHRTASRLRKRRCDACYMRVYRGGELPAGAECVSCGERRTQVLALVRLEGCPTPLCGNCALVLTRTRPRVTTIADLRRRTARERRQLADRRTRQIAQLSGPDRRRGPRRAVDAPAAVSPVPVLDPSID